MHGGILESEPQHIATGEDAPPPCVLDASVEWGG